MIKELNSFDELNNENLIKGIYVSGFETPSNIQKISIPSFMNYENMIIQSRSGSGKTLCFIIGSLLNVNINDNDTQIIIMAPTRELSEQIYNIYVQISSFMNISIGLYRGGININAYERSCKNKADKYKDQIIVCTPGRLLDLLNKKIINILNLKYFILDEFDELLNSGFIQCIKDTIIYITPNTKIALFSATISKEILEISNNLMVGESFKYLLNNDDISLPEIKQYFINVETDKNKLDNLIEIYKNISISQSIIYCNKKEQAEWLTGELNKEYLSAACINGEMELKIRSEIIKNFKTGVIKILVSTDLLSRGIDIQSLMLVINFDIPYKKENYIHRIGRSGRFGKRGVIINIVTTENLKTLLEISNFYNIKIDILPNLSSIF